MKRKKKKYDNMMESRKINKERKIELQKWSEEQERKKALKN